MRSNKWIKVIIFGLLLIITTGEIKVFANVFVPKEVYFNTGQEVVGEIDNGDKTIKARKITSELGVAYCLEIYKQYPSGERFVALGHPSDMVNKILTYGYPNITPAEIGVDTEDEAYFVTQITLWTAIEGFDINAYSHSNPKIVNAIKNMYNKAMALDQHALRDRTMVYYTNDNVQKVATFVPPQGRRMPRSGMAPNGVEVSPEPSAEPSAEVLPMEGYGK